MEIGARMVGSVCNQIMTCVSILIGFWIEWRMRRGRDRACPILTAFAHWYDIGRSSIVCCRAVAIRLPVRKCWRLRVIHV
jgi:hypothetical protein